MAHLIRKRADAPLYSVPSSVMDGKDHPHRNVFEKFASIIVVDSIRRMPLLILVLGKQLQDFVLETFLSSFVKPNDEPNHRTAADVREDDTNGMEKLR